MSDDGSSPFHVVWDPTPDAFGVPQTIFGRRDEEFYGAIGRIAGLSALIEYQALTIYQTMKNAAQTTDTQLSASQLLEKAFKEFKELAPVGDDADRHVLFQYYSDVKTILRARNDYIHNLWPAQPGEALFGWRPNPDKTNRADQPTTTTQTSMDELRAFILQLVELVRRRDTTYVAACALQDVRIRGGVTS
ncbi:ATP-dependent Clp protease, ATP-binding subunit [Leifsonia xyli subsp. cynodontis DSM 46306]|jgi:hypothetical protein|uniref:Uncharacterized protein n=1 Tax=Leifsonia xyli subsp. cynodontis DSM 46306 TaxID=1389489 RepID=U3P7K3_LEIXC|nr:hypothetical protein [Leifsonia xyli]AGW41429.1 ATP-dependent Clp protease, ATP-binding subunit [Leifsonia xyli subsp. cynodontis DSM 46306]